MPTPKVYLKVFSTYTDQVPILKKATYTHQIDSVQAVHPVVLETKLGDIKGTEFFFLSKKIRTFFGVPFAEPAVEDFRFRKPREKKQWRGLYDATKPANACFQTRDNYNTSFWGSEMWNANTQISEDCLYLNIWAPADAYNLTVMVWFFGGGFYSGSPSLSIYDGKALTSTQNVIVVNINYRLGPFGFLYLGHPDAPGNMGLLDQVTPLFPPLLLFLFQKGPIIMLFLTLTTQIFTPSHTHIHTHIHESAHRHAKHLSTQRNLLFFCCSSLPPYSRLCSFRE
nr:hypothetical protein Y48B6A.15 - Caenorhabditis elegans [Caenorhabditis elegans]